MTESDRRTLENLLDEIKPEDDTKETSRSTRQTVGETDSTDSFGTDTFGSDSFGTSGSDDSFSDEWSSESGGVFGSDTKDDSFGEEQEKSLEEIVPDNIDWDEIEDNNQRKSNDRSSNRTQDRTGRQRRQPANQQGGVFIYNPQVVVQGSQGQRRGQEQLREMNQRILNGG